MDTVTDDFNEWQEEYKKRFDELVKKYKDLPDEEPFCLKEHDEPIS